jgi:hypothetical protein
MTKRCIICNEEAKFHIKDTSDFYCQSCAEENFADLNVLIRVGEDVPKQKEKLPESDDDVS